MNVDRGGIMTGMELQKISPSHWCRVGVCLTAWSLTLSIAAEEDSDRKHAAARAVLEARCLACHGPDVQESNLRLDSRAAMLRGGDFGPAVVLGQADGSEILRRVKTNNADDAMPPEGDRLSKDEVDALAAWINDGAPWPGSDDEAAEQVPDARLGHWAWQPIARPVIPERVAVFAALQGVEPERNPIDFFVRARLVGAGLQPTAMADRRTLIRRLTFDLIGLPPTPEEVEAFVNDDGPEAYDSLVQRLLDSPRYGERWARHWLDVVHYGDTHGYDKDKPRPHAWPYRDYVIRALNADKPYARFVEEQVAGDILAPYTADGNEATGFIAAGPWDVIGHREVPETKTDGKIARHLDRDDMVANTIGSFCSVTIHCAQCHNHKFDPISQEDYYSLQAVFAAIDREDRKYSTDPAVTAKATALDAERRSLEGRRDSLQKAINPKLREIERQLASPGKPNGKNPTAAYGYHSGIVARQDVEKWVQLDLLERRELREVRLFPCFDEFNNIGGGFGFPVRYRVEVSDDPAFAEKTTAIVDRTAEDVANPGVTPQVFGVEAAGRYLRVTATRLAPRQNDFIFALAEIEVRAADGKNLAVEAIVTSLDSIEAGPRWQRTNLIDGLSPAGEDGGIEALKAQREELFAKAEDPAQVAAYREVVADLNRVTADLKSLPPMPVVFAAATQVRRGEPRTIQVLSRGNVLSPTYEVGPGSLSLLDPLGQEGLRSRFELPSDHAEGDRRVALARWLTDPANPLTWRSIVNRVWQYHFGTGIVATSSDFGRMGDPPSHPELLDWLATRFRDGGGSLKELHRLIVSSATYRQECRSREDFAAIDGDNRLLWRQNRQRLEAEAIRDAVLAAAGTLDLTMGGPGWQDFKVEHPAHSPHYRYDMADPADRSTWRRGVYRFIVRSQTQPFMTVLDCADPSMRVEKRTESLSALQALALLNNGFMVVQAEEFAMRVQREAGDDPGKQVRRACGLAIGREPTAAEAEELVRLTEDHGLAATCRAIFNLNEFSFVD
jgi:mono/diheme cytochrome c family protein